MAIFTAVLTFLLILISLFLILLVLVQLPKKEAGVGMAFGAGMSEMLLGAGSGNVLTRITKYTIGIFLVLSLILSILITSGYRQGNEGVRRAIEEKARSGASQTPATTPSNPSLLPLSTNAATAPIVSTTVVVNPPAAPVATPTPAPAPAKNN